jgi:hypothetical protein
MSTTTATKTALVELPEGITEKDLERYAKLSKQATTIKGLRDKLNDKIKKSFAGVKYEFDKPYLFGKTSLTFGKQMRFSEELFVKKYPISKYPQFYSMQLDTSLIPEDLKTDRVKTPVVTLKATETIVVSTEVEIDVEPDLENVA